MAYTPTDEEIESAKALWADPQLQKQIRSAVRAEAARMARKAPFPVEIDDLRQVGWLGAWLGCCRCDATRKTKPITYIGYCIHGEIAKHLRSMARRRGTARSAWERGEYQQRESALTEAHTEDRSLQIANPEQALGEMTADSDDARAFHQELPRKLQLILGGMLASMNGTEAAVMHGHSGTQEGVYRKQIRRLWSGFLAAGKRGRCVRSAHGQWEWRA